MNPDTYSADTYRTDLFERVIPFWERHSPDNLFGGYFTCLDRDGTVFDRDKFMWLQARQVWMFSHLYRTVESNERWFETAHLGAEFLLAHGCAPQGRWYFSLLRDGTPQTAPYNIFSDCFAAMALAEYAAVLASRSQHRESERVAGIAHSTWHRIQRDKNDPKGHWNKLIPGGRSLSAMSLPMIQLNMVEVFEDTIGLPLSPALDAQAPAGEPGKAATDRPAQTTTKPGDTADVASFVESLVLTVLDLHLDHERRLVFERVHPDGSRDDSMDGRLLNPGHACEAMWMIMEAGERFGRREWIDRAAEALLWALESGWDSEEGGLYYYLDADGFPPEKLEHDMKLWWPQLESLYGCLVAHNLTGRTEFAEWFARLESYTWNHFCDREYGEWYGYLHRDGTPATRQKGGKWKGCFHVPRILLKTMRRLDRMVADRAAAHFVSCEEQYHLGFLTTEQSHPATERLSAIIAADIGNGIRSLLEVDHDLIPIAQAVIGSAAWERLAGAMAEAAAAGKRVIWSGCGSTGRLAAVLEVMWRRVWRRLAAETADPEIASRMEKISTQAAGIITGGDRALVKSVESFEDYENFGRRQIRDVGVAEGDVCVAISEGGETSSVIGTALEALDSGALVYFVYNNPTDILCRRVERSRRLIEDARVAAFELTTGPMAVTGSTRMQATSIELLVIGSALERAVEIASTEIPGRARGAAGDRKAPDASPANTAIADRPEGYVEGLRQLIESLETEAGVAVLAEMVRIEQEVYERSELVTYLADCYLLDVFSDTSERTPTFNLPPMEGSGVSKSGRSWAFPKHARLPTEQAWDNMLLHPPRCLDWDDNDYRAMNAPERLIAAPPPLSRKHLYEYRIGREGIAGRHGGDHGGAVIGLSVAGRDSDAVASALDEIATSSEIGPHTRRVHVTVATGAPEPCPGVLTLEVPAAVRRTFGRLFEHLAVKLVLNTVSTATMARMGRVQGNFMIQVDPTNKKLIDRGARIIAALTGLSYDEACRELHRSKTRSPVQLDGKSLVAATLNALEAGNSRLR